MARYFKIFILAVCITIGLSSCHVLNQNLMLRTPKNYPYTQFKDSVRTTEYRLAINDLFEFRIFSNDGFRVIDLTSGVGNNNNQNMNNNNNLILSYLVESDGTTKLPLLGRVKVVGMTIRQAEAFLEEKFTSYYNKPFVVLRVVNRRVIIFPGAFGKANVVPLTNNNTTLLEALASIGGISENAKAHRVKLIRGSLQNPDVYLIDLSTIDGIKKADMILQSNDIIYVEPRPRYVSAILTEMAPYISLVTSLLLVYGLIIRPTN